MNKRTALTLFITLSSGLVSMSGCTSRTSIKGTQAIQILEMISYQQKLNEKSLDVSNGDFSYIKTSNNGAVGTIDISEVSGFNRIVHFLDTDNGQDETWVYINPNRNNSLFSTVKNPDNGELVTTTLREDEEEARGEFGQYKEIYQSNTLKKIRAIDNPKAIIEKIKEVNKLDQFKVKSKYNTDKNKEKESNLSASVEVYTDVFKKNLSYKFSFIYKNNYLTSYSSYDVESGMDTRYTISYDQKLSLDSIR